MNRIIAAIDQSPAATPVVAGALALAPLFDAAAQAVHVRENGLDFVESVSAAAGIELRVLHGDPASCLRDELGAPDVAGAVLGARGGVGGARPAGSTVLKVVAAARKPVLVVPPDWVPGASFQRVIVPLDASEVSSTAVNKAVAACACGGLEIVVVHVFRGETVPRFWDRPAYETEDWAREFLSRHCAEPGAHIALRTGPPAREVLDLVEGPGDLMLLAWSQDLSGGRAQLVREVLADSPVPVLLVPVAGAQAMAA